MIAQRKLLKFSLQKVQDLISLGALNRQSAPGWNDGRKAKVTLFGHSTAFLGYTVCTTER